MKILLKTDNGEIPIEVIKSNRKTIVLEIKPDAAVYIRVPILLSQKKIEAVIKNKEEWIIKHHEALVNYKASMDTAENTYSSGTEIPLFNGDFLSLEAGESGRDVKTQVFLNKEGERRPRLIMDIPSMEHQVVRKCIMNWLQSYAKDLLDEKAKQYAGKMQVAFHQISVRDQKTRWGSCSSKRNLSFNWKLVMMPEDIINYVVVHELAHLKQMNHSPQFWNEVGKILPDYRVSRSWLKEKGKEYQKY